MGKDTAIYLRIEEEKKLALEKKAQDAGLSLSTYLVEQGLHGKVVDFSELRKIYPQLMRIGNNINQLAIKANALGFVDSQMLKNEALRWHKFQAAIEREFLRPEKSGLKWQ